MYAFEIERPATIEEAVRALSAEEAQPLAGGQTLIPTLKQRLAMPSVLVSLTGISGLRGIRTDEGGQLCIGASTTHAEVAAGAGVFPGLATMAGRIGDPAVRNRGTMGGSLANNDPSACYPAAALGAGATIVTDRREIAADDFFQGMFDTALDEGEIITEVRFPVPAASAYAKFEQPASRFALVGAFVARFPGGVRVAITGASEGGVFRWAEAEEALSRDFTASALEGVSVPSGDMIGDLHGTPEYRAHLVAIMTRRAVTAAA
ncbi:FAD binding domain-containing protein [Roseovarius dicentrarchi]|uniref:FAD binding domain-containing protein n=1 Tax=Roseovarius dicentrarchi TaxID=2250573 RepID=UPI000DE9940E|nr:xanthine dehydrogenase family protein subunit M [Roseovarius dicentrarchi]